MFRKFMACTLSLLRIGENYSSARSRTISFVLGCSCRYVTPAESSIRLEARVAAVLAYLSDSYSTSLTPAWMMALAHSLQGKRATYSRLPRKSRPLAFKMALSSA